MDTMRTIAIEDEFMRRLREGIGSREERLPVRERDQIYFHGLVKILRSLIAANSYTLFATWFTGCRSFSGLCEDLDEPRLIGGNGYGFVPRKRVPGKRSIMLPIDLYAWEDHIEELCQNVHTIQDYCNSLDCDVLELSAAVGSLRDPGLYLNLAQFLTIEYNRSDDELEYLSRSARKCQEQVIRYLMKGGDFVVYPFGYSLQHLLSLITSTTDYTQSQFRLQAVDNRDDHQLNFL
jgi:hypothetical protein